MKEGREGNWGILKNRPIQREEVTLISAENGVIHGCRYDNPSHQLLSKFWKGQFGGKLLNPESPPR
jgi:hypothetical protein